MSAQTILGLYAKNYARSWTSVCNQGHVVVCVCCRLRDEAASSAKQALAQALQHDPPHTYIAHVARMTAALDSLVAAVHQAATRHQQHGAAAKAAGAAGLNSSRGVSRVNSRQGRGGASERGRQAGSMLALLERCGSDVVVPGGDVAWVKGVVVRLKELLLESDR